MTTRFDHTIVAARDREVSARFYREVVGLAPAPSWGVFTNLRDDEGVLVQFAVPPVDIQPQHYAFRVDDATFDRAHTILVERGIEFWADPQRSRPGEINHDHGGRGVYLLDPAGHFLELLTGSYL